MRRYDHHGTVEGSFQIEVIGGHYAEADGLIIYDSSIYIAIAKIASAIKIVNQTKGEVFASGKAVRVGHGYTMKLNERASVVLAAMRLSIYESGYERSKGSMRLSPYVHAFFECQKEFQYEIHRIASKEEVEGSLQKIHLYAKNLFLMISNDAFRRAKANHLRAANERSRRLCEYIDYLVKAHARLLVVRLDLSYHKSPEEIQAELDGNNIKVFNPEMDLHRIAFFQELSKKDSPFSMVGYVCKLEHAPRKGFHYHIMLFLDGSKVREQISIGAVIGKLWSEDITGGDGHYWNCVDTQWVKADGTGRLDHYDPEQLVRVKQAASYLAKQDIWVRVYIGENRRTFYRGVIRLPRSKGGRPRTKRSGG